MNIFGNNSPAKAPARWEPKKRQCNCKNSRCLKLYCECFASGEYCDNCNCQTCCNNIENASERNAAIEATLDRNPAAFQPKIAQSPQKVRAITSTARARGLWLLAPPPPVRLPAVCPSRLPESHVKTLPLVVCRTAMAGHRSTAKAATARNPSV